MTLGVATADLTLDVCCFYLNPINKFINLILSSKNFTTLEGFWKKDQYCLQQTITVAKKLNGKRKISPAISSCFCWIISALIHFYWDTLVLSFEAHGHTIACEGGRDLMTLYMGTVSTSRWPRSLLMAIITPDKFWGTNSLESYQFCHRIRERQGLWSG